MSTGHKAIIGKRFGRLTVVSLDHTDPKNSRTYWLCKCDCGNTKIVWRSNLLTGNTSSCGCIRKRLTKEEQEFEYLKRTTITAARELCYGDDVEDALLLASTEGELMRIMKNARLRN